MRNIGINFVATFLLCMLACSAVFGQSTAQVSGGVKDQTGAVLPGAEVTMTQTETGLKRTTVTDETGSYSLPNLPIGPYRLEASLPGFRLHLQTGIVLQVNSNPVMNIVLQVGQVSDEVEVQVVGIEPETGKIRLSRKPLLPPPTEEELAAAAAARANRPPREDRGDRGDRGGRGDRGDHRRRRQG